MHIVSSNDMHARVCLMVYAIYMKTMKHYPDSISLKGLIRSFKSAFRGIRVLLRSEYNLYIQIGFAVIAIAAGWYFSISSVQWMFQIIVIGLVIYSELVNTAIEKILDVLHPEYRREVGEIKELASASVLFMVLISVCVGSIIYIPYIF